MDEETRDGAVFFQPDILMLDNAYSDWTKSKSDLKYYPEFQLPETVYVVKRRGLPARESGRPRLLADSDGSDLPFHVKEQLRCFAAKKSVIFPVQEHHFRYSRMSSKPTIQYEVDRSVEEESSSDVEDFIHSHVGDDPIKESRESLLYFSSYTREDTVVDPLEDRHTSSLLSSYHISLGTTFDWPGSTASRLCGVVEEVPVMEDHGDMDAVLILIEIEQLTTRVHDVLGDFEPLYGFLSLYDISGKVGNRQRISEVFSFVMHGKESERKDYPAALFRVRTCSEEVVAVLRVSRILTGDEDTASDPFCKPVEKIKKNELERIKSGSSEARERWTGVVPGEEQGFMFLQGFAWTAFRIVLGDTAAVERPRLDIELEVEPLRAIRLHDGMDRTVQRVAVDEFFRTPKGSHSLNDLFVIELLAEKQGSGLSSTKPVNCRCILYATRVGVAHKHGDFSFSYVDKKKVCLGTRVVDQNQMVSVEDADEGVVSPSRQENSCRIIAEVMQEFPVIPYTIPILEAQNEIFVTLLSVNFSGRSWKSGPASSARNVNVEVELRSNDELLNFGCGPVVGVSHVNYHRKTPSFFDEFSVSLPNLIEPRHHLLFTFRHVTCKKRKDQDASKYISVIGYAVVPLLGGGSSYRILPSGVHQACVFLDGTFDKQTYLSNIRSVYGPDCLDWQLGNSSDDSSRVFTFSVQTKSTLYPTDEYLGDFFFRRGIDPARQKDPKVSENATLKALGDRSLSGSVRQLLSVSPVQLFQFMPVVLDMVFHLMSDASVSLGTRKYAFHTALRLFELLETGDQEQDAEDADEDKTSEYSYDSSADVAEDQPRIKRGRKSILASYFKHHWQPPTNSEGLPVHELLVHLWIELLQTGRSSAADIEKQRGQHGDRRGVSPVKSASRRGHSDERKLKLLSFQYSWCLYECILKSIQIGKASGEGEVSAFLDTFQEFLVEATFEMRENVTLALNVVQDFNAQCALFQRELVVIPWARKHRGAVCGLMARYIDRLGVRGPEPVQRIYLSCSFLEIITDSDFLIPLSIPFSTNDYHYIVSLLLDFVCHHLRHDFMEVRTRVVTLLLNILAKHEMDKKYRKFDTRKHIFRMYYPFARFVLLNHRDIDKLIKQRQMELTKIIERKSKKCEVLEAEIQRWKKTEDDIELKDSAATLHSARRAQLALLDNEKIALGKSKDDLRREQKRVSAEGRGILVCFLTILFRIPQRMLRDQILSVTGIPDLLSILEEFGDISSVFEYSSSTVTREECLNELLTRSRGGGADDRKRYLENVYASIRGTHGAGKRRRDLQLMRKKQQMVRRKTVKASQGSQYRSSWRQSMQVSQEGDSIPEVEMGEMADRMVRGSRELCSSVSWGCVRFLVLAWMEWEKRIDEKEHREEVLQSIFDILLGFSEKPQSDTVFEYLLTFLKYIVSQNAVRIFCGDENRMLNSWSECLCRRMLSIGASSKSELARRRAASVLLALIRHNYISRNGHFAKTKVEMSVALSELVSTIESEVPLQRVFELIVILSRGVKVTLGGYNVTVDGDSMITSPPHGKALFATPPYHMGVSRSHSGQELTSGKATGTPTDRSLSSNFSEVVEEWIRRLRDILADTVRVSKMRDVVDEETLEDMYERISVGYSHMLELRGIWMNNLANFHADRGNYAEGAQCILHICALVVEYLFASPKEKEFSKTVLKHLPLGVLVVVSPALRKARLDEWKTLHSQDVSELQSSLFSKEGFMRLLTKIIEFLQKAELYEYCNEMYKLVIPIYEMEKNYPKLAESHHHLGDMFQSLFESQTRRLFGTYYKVGFYALGDNPVLGSELQGKEFVYKMPRISRLAEIKEKLEQYFARRLGGKELVKICSGTQDMGKVEMEDKVVYIQIQSVQPISDDCGTFFEQNTAIDTFVYETPFTKSGKSHGALKDQYKKKTVIKTEHVFPHTRVRLLVVDHKETILEPIETATDLVQSRNEQLLQVAVEPPDINALQMALQGSVRVQVNSGLGEVVDSFLGSGKEKEFDPESVVTLKKRLREFLVLCEKAVRLGRKYVSDAQRPFHEELEKGYKEMHEYLAPVLRRHGQQTPRKERNVTKTNITITVD